MKQSYSILIPHYRVGKATAHAVAQVLMHSEGREIQIIVINNSVGHDSIELITKTNMRHHVEIIDYPIDRLQSHGIALDYALASLRVKHEYFIMLESDAYPDNHQWLDLYDQAAAQGFDCIGSLLQLSGGYYLHPCGAMYKQSVWKKAFNYCREIENMYYYFPNMIMKDGHPCHAMVKKDLPLGELIVNDFEQSYKNITWEQLLKRAENYSPTINPFHNGMGNNQETIKTYGQRTLSDAGNIMLDGKENVITRMGYEPGQWFFYWMLANGCAIGEIDTQVEWLPNRINQQQAFTRTENGVIHCWAGTSYYNQSFPGLEDITTFKTRQVDDLYDKLPENFKV